MEERATARTADSYFACDGLPLSEWGRAVVEHESVVLKGLAAQLDDSFHRAVECVLGCRGAVIVSGMGKAGLVGRKIAATLSSTGTRAHFLHPAEAIHGDLGCIHRDDVVLMLSQSGETEEVIRLLPSLRRIGVKVIAITASKTSTLGRAAAETLALGRVDEAGTLGLAPSASTTAMLALGDAMALVASRVKGFRAEDFAQFHPGGSLGRKLSLVDEHMRPLDVCRIASQEETVREVYVAHGMPARRTGATLLVDASGCLTGIFTDSDLARLFEQRRDDALDQPIRSVMTASPTTVTLGSKMMEAISLMAERKISELPVLNGDGKPAGVLDITDLVGAFPEWEERCGGVPSVRVFPGPDRRSA